MGSMLPEFQLLLLTRRKSGRSHRLPEVPRASVGSPKLVLHIETKLVWCMYIVRCTYCTLFIRRANMELWIL
jgi:hypothetical protein